MKLLAYISSLFARFFRRSRIEEDVEEELQLHLQLRAEDLERAGMDRAQAERQARIEFGAHQRVKEECRDELSGNSIETFIKDVRYSLRVLRNSPAFTIVAVLTLAVAIGANAVVFGVLNGLILRPLDVPQPESLYGIEHANEHSMYESYPDYLDLRDRNRSFDGLAGFDIQQVGLDTGDNSSHAWSYLVTGNYFDVLRIQPFSGRFFHASDEHGPGSAPYIVLSSTFWHNHFQDDPAVIGRIVRLNKHPFTVIGVAPPEFHGTLAIAAPDLYVPFVNQEQVVGRDALNARGSQTVFMTLGHLRPGVTPQQAAVDLNSVGSYLEKTYPRDHGVTTFVLARPGLYGNYLGGPMKAFVTGLLALSGLILLAACANLGSLFAARAADRGRDIALRLALGASRSRVLRQLLTEAVLVSIAGGALGLWGSVVLLKELIVWHPFPKFPLTVPVSPDGSIYAVALVLALVSGFLFGIVPVRQVLRTDPYQIVKAGPGGRMGRRVTVRDLLLAAQIAICAVLVTSSMVAVRGLVRSLHSNFGFDPRNAILVEADLNIAGYRGDQAAAMQKRMIDALEAIPDVESVGSVARPPMNGSGFSALVFNEETTDLRPSTAIANAVRFNVSPRYFHAARTPLLAGREFSWHDDKNSPRVAVASRELARKAFGSATNAVGGHFRLRDGTRLEIVGVVEDGKYESLTEDLQPALFLPMLQAPMSETCLVVRSNRDPAQLASAIRTKLHSVDSGLPAFIETWNQQLEFVLFPSRVATASLGVLGGMGAILAITGIFGMAANSVSKRLKELGIRMALGAKRKEVLQAALGRAFYLLIFGSGAGLFLGILATRILAFIVYQATPRDPLVIAAAVFSMFLLGLLATWVPARRALSNDPLTLLREE